MEITEKKIKELGLDKSELLAIALFSQANEWIGKHKDFVCEQLRKKYGSKIKLSAADAMKIYNSMPLSTNFDDVCVRTHRIGTGSYSCNDLEAFRLYHNICKDLKIREEKFEIVEANKVSKNECGLSVLDFLGNDDLRPAMKLIFMDDNEKKAVATDAHWMFANPNEYVNLEFGAPMLKDSLGGVLSTRDFVAADKDLQVKYPNWKSVCDFESRQLEIREDLADVVKRCEAMVKACSKMVKKSEICAAVKLNIRGNDDYTLERWVQVKFAKTIVKCGLNGYVTGSNQCSKAKAIKKEFSDGSILLLMPCLVDDILEKADKMAERNNSVNDFVVYTNTTQEVLARQ